jgi:CRP/FNR family transcriptional regulator
VKWIKQYPDINTLFFMQYNSRYSELLDTINHILFDSLDKRIFTFLEERIRVTKQNPIKISHRQIASELGTAREVVSRILKRLETEGKIKQHTNSIEFL